AAPYRKGQVLHSVFAAAEENAASEADVKWLESVSGLPVSALRVLFGMSKTDFSAGKSLIAALWMYDPDKQL
ncbi:MAG: hypothetical protein ACTIAS_24845, partial [Pseudomonas helleri]